MLSALFCLIVASCGNDEPTSAKVARVEVNYSLDLSSDLVNLLDMTISYVDGNGTTRKTPVVGTSFYEKATFTSFPSEFGFSLSVNSVKEPIFDAEKYQLKLSYNVSAVSYDDDGNVIQDCPSARANSFTYNLTSDKIADFLKNEVEIGQYFATSNDIDKNGKIIVVIEPM